MSNSINKKNYKFNNDKNNSRQIFFKTTINMTTESETFSNIILTFSLLCCI